MWLRILLWLAACLIFASRLYSQTSKPARTTGSGGTAVLHHTVFSSLSGFIDTILPGGDKASRTHHAKDYLLHKPLPQSATRQPAVKQGTDAPQFDGSPLSLTLQVTSPDCQWGNGIIIASASGGTPPYRFAFENDEYSSLAAFTTVPEGSYTIHVKDAQGQTADAPATITHTYPMPGVHFTSFTNPSGCTTFDGALTLEGTGGQPPYTYSIDQQNYQSSGIFTNLPPNWYYYEIKDAHGCSGYYSYIYMGSPTCRFGFGIAAGAPNCSTTGSARLDATGGTPPYQYSSDGIHFQNDGNLTGIPLGLPVVYAKDANNDTVAFGLQLSSYCRIEMQAEVTDIPCFNPNHIQGSIVVAATNGVAPYEYSMDGIHYQTSNRFDNLPFGTYSIVTRDAEGKPGAITTEVKGGCLLMVVEPEAAACDGKGGTITVHANGGKAPYRYSIDGTAYQDNAVFAGVAPGTYNVTTKDADGQTVSEEDIIIGTSSGAVIGTVNTTPASCSGNDGTFTVGANGGVSPLQYSINGTLYQSSSLFTGVSSGSYTVFVKDANGCLSSLCCQPVAQQCLSATASATPATCGQPNGSLTVSVVQGAPPYRYSLDGITYQNSNVFTHLLPGNVTVNVRDGNGFTITIEATVARVCIDLQTDVVNTTCGNHNGSLQATASGGAAPYRYSTNGVSFQDGNTFEQLAAGQYTLQVKDANNVVQTRTVTIAGSTQPQLSATATAAGCINNNGTLSATVSGAVAPLFYRMDNGTFQSSPFFTALEPGTHTLESRDANGCTAAAIAAVPLNSDLQADAGADLFLCEGSQASLHASPGAAVSVRWEPAETLDNPASPNPTASPSITTRYYLRVSTPSCAATDSVLVNVYKAPAANAGDDVTVCYGKPAELTGTGGTRYNWQPQAYLSNSSLPRPLAKCPPGRHAFLLSVTDENGCHSLHSDTAVVYVTPPARVFAGRDTLVVRGQPFQMQAEDVNSSGFATYQWLPSAGLSCADIANPVATVTKDIQYTVTAHTADGCAGTDSIWLKAYAGPDIYVPSAFSPNGDGHNDVVCAIPVGIVSFRYFAIYDRFGKRVFYTTQPDWGWNGTLGGMAQPAETYVWMTAGTDINQHLLERKGTLVLLK